MKYILCTAFLLLASCQSKDLVQEKLKAQTKQMNIQYAYTILYVQDVPATMEFYKKVFQFEQKLLTPENDYGELKSGTTTLAFASLELGRSNFTKGFSESSLGEKPFGIELALATPEVDKVMEIAIENGAVLLEKAMTKPWGQKVGYLRDLNGFIIEVCTPIPEES